MSYVPFEGLKFASGIRKEHGRHVDFIRNLEVDLGWLHYHGSEHDAPIDSSGSIQTFCNVVAHIPRLATITIVDVRTYADSPRAHVRVVVAVMEGTRACSQSFLSL